MTELNDKELENFLRRDSSLSRAYGALEDEDIPPLLEARVKSHAHAALRTRRAGWWLPLSAAALILVAVGLALQVRQDERSTGQVAAKAALTAETAPEVAAVNTRSAAAADAALAATKVPAPEPGAVASVEARSAPAAIAPAPPAAIAAVAPVERAADFVAPAQDAASAAGAASAEREIERQEMATQASAARTAKAAAGGELLRMRAPHRSPQEWLRTIAALREQGRAAEAEAELARYRLAYPDGPQPEAPAGTP